MAFRCHKILINNEARSLSMKQPSSFSFRIFLKFELIHSPPLFTSHMHYHLGIIQLSTSKYSGTPDTFQFMQYSMQSQSLHTDILQHHQNISS